QSVPAVVRGCAAACAVGGPPSAGTDARVRPARVWRRGSAALLSRNGHPFPAPHRRTDRGRARREAVMARRVAKRATATHPDDELVHAYLAALTHQRRL